MGRLALGRRCGLRGSFGFLRHHLRAQLGVGRQHTVVRAAGVRSLRETKLRGHQTDQVQPGARQGRPAVAPSVTHAASRCMNSSGDTLAGRALAELVPFGWHKQSTGLFVFRLSTKCVVPSRQGILSLSTTCQAALVCTRSSALSRGRGGAAQLPQRLAIIGAAAHGGLLRCCPGCRRTAIA